MQTECTATQLEFEGLGSRRVVAGFTAGRTSSEGGLLELPRSRGQLSAFGDLPR